MNYRQELEKTLLKERGKGKKLLLHSCCAPCSSHVLTLLKEYFAITVLYYNPNITERDEYEKRVREQIRFIEALNHDTEGTDISYMDGEYVPGLFLETVKGYEHVPEGGARCKICFEMRLRETARLAKEGGFDYFATTLTVSPPKDYGTISAIGKRLGAQYGVSYLDANFKKKDGFKRSRQIALDNGFYLQNFCGCRFSCR